MDQDTIAAIATGIGNAGIGIVRISGIDAVAIADKIFRGSCSLTDVKSHHVQYGHIVDVFKDLNTKDMHGKTEYAAYNKNKPEMSDNIKENEIIDEVLVTVFRAPRSYTREDVVEISSHGGSFVMRKILSLVYRAGARAAEAGEFTKRAFLNGRIDLSQAESVMDIIASDNERMLHNSLRQLDGALSLKIKALREEILHEIAYIEAALDDPEHYDLDAVKAKYEQKGGKIEENDIDIAVVDDGSVYDEILPYAGLLLKKIGFWKKKIQILSATADEGRILREGIRTVIVGRPNVGKSSILNVLAKEDRAIVTDVPGTTRDTIEEKVRLGDMVLAVTDTAGIRRTDDPVESIGVEKSIQKLDEADLILYVVDASEALTDEDKTIIGKLIPEKTIVLLNKVDLVKDGHVVRENPFSKILFESGELNYSKDLDIPKNLENHIIPVSAKKGLGFEQLTEEIRQMFFTGDVDNNVDIFITNARHVRLLESANVSLSLVEKSINDAMPEDFLTADLMDAYAFLGEIIGEAVEDDLVEKVFSEFCMGK